ncbi:FusB/FusC family EF-G-binding protein [Fredinandcohnia humi]
MEPFIKSDQYNFIRKQTETILSSYNTVNDTAVLNAVCSISQEKVLNLFPNITDNQKQLLMPILDIKNPGNAEEYLSAIKPYVIPFKDISEATIKKLFPKMKKLKVPKLELDYLETTYIHWHDKGSNKNFMIVPLHTKQIGVIGTFTPANKKGICTICNKIEEVGMFISEKKGSVPGTFVKKGNYICKDPMKCNKNLTSLDKLHEFVTLLN